MLEELLTESQREKYRQRIFNGGSVLDGSKWQEHVPPAPAPQEAAPGGIDAYIIAHQVRPCSPTLGACQRQAEKGCHFLLRMICPPHTGGSMFCRIFFEFLLICFY